MNYGPLIFLAAFLGLSASWFGLVLAPQIQLGREVQATNTVNTAELYPVARPGLAAEGLEVYRANGCVYCHSQQVGQTGTVVSLILSNPGTNPVAVAEALLKANLGLTNVNGAGLSVGTPKTLLHGVSITAAKAGLKVLKDHAAEGRIDIVPVGPDIARGWGSRRTVAQDFLFDNPVMLGAQRVGPDLANVGTRLPDLNWHLRHLYAPRAEMKDSVMPSFRFLFEQRKRGSQPSADALALPKEFAPAEGYEIVPKPEARALAAYLVSLKAGTPVFETPMSVASAPAAAATNSPAK